MTRLFFARILSAKFDEIGRRYETHDTSRASPIPPANGQIVDSFPDYKIEMVNSFPDFTIEYVKSFPGPAK